MSYALTCSGTIQAIAYPLTYSWKYAPNICLNVPHIRVAIYTAGTNVSFLLASRITFDPPPDVCIDLAAFI